jgi:photosynthetic reaction center H subunit
MQTGAITGYIDVAQLVLYGFWIFFVALIIYLRKEDKREGYPLESDRSERADRVRIQGFPAMPAPKTFLLAHGGTSTVPDPRKDARPIHATPVAPWPGAPLEPTGDPLADGVGPAAYAERSDSPDLTFEGLPMIVPMRVASDFSVVERDPDPRGMDVLGADGNVAGVVKDLWVDRTEPQIRYLEVAVDAGATSRVALLPIQLARIDGYRRQVRVKSILAAQFAGVPALQQPDQVTLREEDRICAYYAGGNLYAEASRLEPLI